MKNTTKITPVSHEPPINLKKRTLVVGNVSANKREERWEKTVSVVLEPHDRLDGPARLLRGQRVARGRHDDQRRAHEQLPSLVRNTFQVAICTYIEEVVLLYLGAPRLLVHDRARDLV